MSRSPIRLGDLNDVAGRQLLRRCFTEPDSLRPDITHRDPVGGQKCRWRACFTSALATCTLVVVVGDRIRKIPLKRPAIVSIAYDASRLELAISEPQHGARRHALAADGAWSGRVQADGRRPQALSGKYPADDGIGPMATAKELIVVYGKSLIALLRTDHGRPAIEERPMKPDPAAQG